MRIYSWNVNSLRSCIRKGFEQWLESAGADLVGLQEVRASHEQVDEALSPDVQARWQVDVVPADKPGYSGVGLFSRGQADRVIGSTGHARFDLEGRTQFAWLGELVVVNCYFPNAAKGGRRLAYKLAFNEHLRDLLQPNVDAGVPVVLVGDFNVAHQPIDLAHPERMADQSGYRPPERADFQKWLDAGWTDTWRHLHPDRPGYTWWNNAERDPDGGWRFDYILASPAALAHVQAVEVHPDVFGSDHCPLSAVVDDAICG